MKHDELVKALLHCSKSGVVECNGCEYDGKEWPVGCMEAMMQDAAAAIEELQAEIRESMQKCAECSKWNEPLQVGKAGNQFTLNATEPPQEES